MNLSESMWIQSGDDQQIVIRIPDEDCDDFDIEDIDAYWELRKTMNSEAILTKTSYGNDVLPTSDDAVYIDTVNNLITISLSAFETETLYGEYFQYLYIVSKTTYKKRSIMYGVLGFIENPNSEYPAITYTSPEMIVRQLRLTGSDGSNLIFTEQTDPPRSLVVEYIREAETRIDRETKNSWRENQVMDEFHDIPFPLRGRPIRDVVVNLRFSKILPWDPSKGDSLDVWENGRWVSYAEKPQSVHGHSWWIDYKIGQIHFNNFWPWFFSGSNRVKITYRWGDVQDEVPMDIREVATKLVSIRLLQSEFNKIMLYNRASNPIDWNSVIAAWEKDINAILFNRRRRIISVVTR